MTILGLVLLLLGLLVALPAPLNSILIIVGILLMVAGLWFWVGPVPQGGTRRRFY